MKGMVICWVLVASSPLIVLVAAKLLLRWNVWRVGIAVALAIWGFAIFGQMADQDPVAPCRIVRDFVSGINAFTSSRWDHVALRDARGLVIQYVLLEYLTLLYSIALGFAVLGRRICNLAWAVLRVWAVRFGHVHMFWGCSRETMALLQDMRSQHPTMRWPIVALANDGSESDSVRRARFDELEDLGATPVYEDVTAGLRSGAAVPKDGIRRLSRWLLGPDRHFLFGDDDWTNVELCKTIVQVLKPCDGEPCRHKTLYVKLRSGDAAEELAIWASRNDAELSKRCADVRILLVPEMIARSLVLAHPVILSSGVDRSKCPANATGAKSADPWARFRMLVVGGGHNGAAVLNASICDAQFEGMDFSATLVDNSRASRGRYVFDYGECQGAYKVEIPEAEDETDALSAAFYSWFERAMTEPGGQPYARVAVCLRSAETNRLVAMRIGKILSAHREMLVAHGLDPQEMVFACSENGVGEQASPSRTYRTFGAIRDVFSVANVIAEGDCTLAKSIHYAYVHGKLPDTDSAGGWRYDATGPSDVTEADWVRAGYYDRRASIACAAGMANWFRLCGWCGTDLMRDTVGRAEAARRIEDNIDYFARCEHLRWNACQLTSGIRPACHKAGDGLPFDERRGFIAKFTDADGMVRRHAAIVPFDELGPLDAEIDKLNRKAYERRDLKDRPALSSLCMNDVKIIEAVLEKFKREGSCHG